MYCLIFLIPFRFIQILEIVTKSFNCCEHVHRFFNEKRLILLWLYSIIFRIQTCPPFWTFSAKTFKGEVPLNYNKMWQGHEYQGNGQYFWLWTCFFSIGSGNKKIIGSEHPVIKYYGYLKGKQTFLSQPFVSLIVRNYYPRTNRDISDSVNNLFPNDATGDQPHQSHSLVAITGQIAGNKKNSTNAWPSQSALDNLIAAKDCSVVHFAQSKLCTSRNNFHGNPIQ